MEKKAFKISLSTFFLILAIIVIVVMGFFMFKINNDKNIEVQKSKELSVKVNELNQELSTLQGKIDSISATINTNTTNVNSSTTVNNEKKFTDNEVKTTLLNYLELYGDSKCSNLLGALTSKGLLPSYDSTGTFDYTWTKTTLKYSDYKKAMLNFISEKEYEKYWKTGIETIKETEDGYLAYNQGGGDRPNFEVTSVSNKNENNYTGSYAYYYDDSNNKETKTCNFTITSYNGKCVIDSIDNNIY